MVGWLVEQLPAPTFTGFGWRKEHDRRVTRVLGMRRSPRDIEAMSGFTCSCNRTTDEAPSAMVSFAFAQCSCSQPTYPSNKGTVGLMGLPLVTPPPQTYCVLVAALPEMY